MIASRASPSTSSSIGTISGGSETIRSSPSTTVVSLLKAFMLSFVCALAAPAAIAFSCFFAFAPRSLAWISSAVSRAYQTSRLLISANSRIASRYARPTVSTRLAALGVREAAVAAGDLEARREALDVPLERARAASRRSR